MDARDRKEQDRGQHDLGESGPIVSRERGGHLGSGERNVRKKTHRQRQARYAIRQAGAWNDGSQTHALITCDVRIFTSSCTDFRKFVHSCGVNFYSLKWLLWVIDGVSVSISFLGPPTSTRCMVREGWVSRLGVPIFEPRGRDTQGSKQQAWRAGPGCISWPAKQLPPKAAAAARVVFVDFDDVLFHTPRRPCWWPFHGYADMVQSLLPPCVPACLGDAWFNAEVVQEVARLQADPGTWTVAHTFRTNAFQKRVEDVLAQAPSGLQFDSARFRPVCSCCSPLGLTRTGEAGYGRLTSQLTEEPQRADDKHLLVILGDVLNDCPEAMEVLLFLSTNPHTSAEPCQLEVDRREVVAVQPCASAAGTRHPFSGPFPGLPRNQDRNQASACFAVQRWLAHPTRALSHVVLGLTRGTGTIIR